MLNFIEYLADNTKLIKIWNKLPLYSKKLIYSFLLNIWLFPVLFYKIYYFAISIIYPNKKLGDIKLENLKSSEYIKKTNYNLLIDAMFKSNLVVFDIKRDYQNICVLIKNKKELLNFFKILRKNTLLYISFESHLGSTISTKLLFIPIFFLNYLLSLSHSFYIYQKFRSNSNRVLFAERLACKTEIWITEKEYYKRTNNLNKSPFKIASEKWLYKNNFLIKNGNIQEFNIRTENDFPIDIVYTWVNDNDPEWQNSLNKTIKESKDKNTFLESSASQSRYTNRDELKYSLRSICMYANFFRKVFIVTAGQTPEWLSINNSRIQLVNHKEIFPEYDCLPTFNSHAIESRLHHIKGLNEHFIYFNDDFFIGRPISSKLFFENEHISYIFYSDSTYIGLNDTNNLDITADAAAKNNRNLILNEFNDTVIEKFLHVPYALRKSILFEIENKFSVHLSKTAKNKFRSITDLSLASSLYQHYSYHKGLSILGKISHEHINLENKNINDKLDSILSLRESQRPDTLCINEGEKESYNIQEENTLVKNFLENYYPIKSEFEK